MSSWCGSARRGHEELGLGAVVDGHDLQLVLNEDLVRAVAPPGGYIEAEEQRQLAEIERRRQHYVEDRSPVAVEGRTIIVVYDGIATGATVKAALRGLATQPPGTPGSSRPRRAGRSLEELAAECDEVGCLATPEPFYAVGPHDRDFRQTEDAEVVSLLDEAREW